MGIMGCGMELCGFMEGARGVLLVLVDQNVWIVEELRMSGMGSHDFRITLEESHTVSQYDVFPQY